MTHQDLVDYLTSIGYQVEHFMGGDHQEYLIIRNYEIPTGRLKGTNTEIGILKVGGAPYVAPAAIHTKHILVPMKEYGTQNSGIGPEWQYWSRLLRGLPSPKAFVVHIATIFSEVQ